MTGNLKPYPRMRDSGVPWLGEVPEHWDLRNLKHAVTFTGGGTPCKVVTFFWSGRIPWVSPKEMTYHRISDAADHITGDALSKSATTVVAPGALLMASGPGYFEGQSR